METEPYPDRSPWEVLKEAYEAMDRCDPPLPFVWVEPDGSRWEGKVRGWNATPNGHALVEGDRPFAPAGESNHGWWFMPESQVRALASPTR